MITRSINLHYITLTGHQAWCDRLRVISCLRHRSLTVKARIEMWTVLLLRARLGLPLIVMAVLRAYRYRPRHINWYIVFTDSAKQWVNTHWYRSNTNCNSNSVKRNWHIKDCMKFDEKIKKSSIYFVSFIRDRYSLPFFYNFWYGINVNQQTVSSILSINSINELHKQQHVIITYFSKKV